MRRTTLLRIGLVAVLAAGLRIDVADEIRLTGAAPADAKNFYTKKRVNGRWISGRFPKRSVARTSDPEQPRSAIRTGIPGQRTDGAPTPLVSVAAPVPAGALAASVSASDGERLDKLRQALQARVNALTTGSVGIPDAARPAPEPQSVSLDFQSGIKTTLFSDGTIIREPFDIAALKSLASPREGASKR